MNNNYTWRSYVFLTVSILLLLSMLGLDFLAAHMRESLVVMLIGALFIASIVFAFITMINRQEKKLIAYFALALTIVNIGVSVFFLWLGAQFAP